MNDNPPRRRQRQGVPLDNGPKLFRSGRSATRSRTIRREPACRAGWRRRSRVDAARVTVAVESDPWPPGVLRPTDEDEGRGIEMATTGVTGERRADVRTEFDREATDLDLEPITSEDEDYESAPPVYRIATYPADYTLEVLHQKWKAGDIRIPDFQRGFVWKQTQASKLIESFLVRLPVPAVFFYSERGSQKYLVIDGQQRLKSVFQYLDGHFGEGEEVFTLKGLDKNSRFNEKKFEDLREEDQRRLKNAVLRAFIVEQLDPDDDTSMYHIFERLNTGGTLLTNQEIRNCVYNGNFVEFLKDVNGLPDWRAILGKEEPDNRRRDIELLVRFFAMKDISAYKKPMKEFLSKFMRQNKDATDAALKNNRDVLVRTCRSVVEKLGEKPFHVRSGLNPAVFDAVMVAFSTHLDKIPDDVYTRYKNLMESGDFDQDTKRRTTDVERVRARFLQASQRLFGA